MPRHPRVLRPGLIHHAIARFAKGEFRIRDERYRDEYFRRVGDAVARCDWKAVCACAMCSHTHLGFVAGLDASERFFRSLHTGYAMWLNKQDGQHGPVYSDRPKLIAFEGESLLALVAYIHNNPVHAKLVRDPSDSPWSTHRAYVGLVAPPPWLDVELGLSLCGFDSSPRGRAQFHDAVVARIHDPVPDIFDPDAQRDVRREARTALGAPVETATPLVQDFGEAARIEIVARGGVLLRGRWLGDPTAVVAAAAAALRIPVDAMRGRTRNRAVVRARRIALGVWVDLLGRPACEMACALGLADSSAARLRSTRLAGDELELAMGIAERVLGLRDEIT